ncbi:MAG: ATP-binding protein [Pyrinomonadaceae bacterium]
MGTRKALPYLGGGLLFLAIVSLIASRLFLFDILFPPTLFAAAISALVAHTQRLSSIDLILTKRLLESSNKPNPLGNAKSSSRLASSLKLLDTVLSPKEAVVFQRDSKGKLISVARLRASSNGPETARNSTWRKGIEQCERSISTRELITQQLNNGESYTNLSVPLCHEDRAVGALLVRVGDDFEDGDSPLLLALAGQLARNLHREETFRHTDRQFRKSYLSTTASARRLELMDVLYGLLAEQRFGINMLAEISDGIAIAYLEGTLAYANPAFLQFARLSREQAEALNLFDLLQTHELRTPITSINGFSELLMADNELSEQTREFVTIIANESQRLSRMINTFLAVTQLERKDKQEVLKIPLRLDDIVRETVMNLQPMAKKKRIRLVEQVNQRIPPVAADKSLISQAVKNLVSNAIKYSPERTTVTVSTALEAEAVRLCVEDRGFGIPPEAVDRVWEKFYRVTREGQDKDDESTGLGLSFVREVVEQHGGAVSVETEEGRGSKFSFTLPRL